jgi:adenosyl cobinamide kinase/adenosyl cobinamide phosphate guanylyltransferase
MILVIGGYAQGKLAYVKERFQVKEEQIYDGCLPEIYENWEQVGMSGADEVTEQENNKKKGVNRSAEVIVVTNFNKWIADYFSKEMVTEKTEATATEMETAVAQCISYLKDWLKAYPKSILISEEVGCGIVPMDKKERQRRDNIGAVQVALAKEADEVVRVVCGINQKIK